MELIAHRPLTGTGLRGNKYRAEPGDRFEVTQKVATLLMRRGLASVPPPPAPDPPPMVIPQMLPVNEGLESIQSLIRQQPEQAKAVTQYEDKAIRPTDNKRRRGRPSQRTRCKACGTWCDSARSAKQHCKEK